jgi:subtilisin family serine protease
MHCTSSFRNPTSPRFDREKPEVAAPGTNISSLKLAAPGFFCPSGNVGTGTSYSSPMVAGIAALMMSGRPSLRVHPEAVKALILAGATHNIEGSARLSERDGAGGTDALASYESAINGNYRWMSVSPASFDSAGLIAIDVGYLLAGQRLKVALVWDSNPSSNYSTDALKADLDLFVEGSGVIQRSASWDNSYEVVDFIVPSFGYYTIKIRKWRFDGAREYVAVAWNQKGLEPFPLP